MDSILADFTAPPPGIRIKRRWNASAKVLIGTAATCFLFAAIAVIVTVATLKVVPHAFWQKEVDDDTPVTGVNGMASSGNTYANQVAVNVMKKGGNAVDAAIAAALVIGVRNPFASGIGGGGVMLIHLTNGTDLTLDCRETAPASVYQNIFVDHPGTSARGGLSIGIPGELKCLDEAFHHYGSRALTGEGVTWAELFSDAIATARDGFEVNALLAFRLASIPNIILNDPGLKKTFTNSTGGLKRVGDIVKMPELAVTLNSIALYGVEQFYNGHMASTVLSEINGFNGTFVADDLKNYTLQRNGVYNTTYRDYRVVGAPLPFAGSLMLMQTLNVLESFNLAKAEGFDAESLHLVIEAAKFGFGNRMLLGDPRFTNLTSVIAKMLSKDRARTRIAPQIDRTKVHPFANFYIDLGEDDDIRNRFSVQPPNDHGTTHISIVDKSRMAVSFTTSINLNFGSGCMGTTTGIIYNDQLDDFSTPAQSGTGTGNDFPVDPTNFPAAGKRPLSSMTPTFVFEKDSGRLLFVAGGAGGPRIFSGTLQTFLNVYEFGYNIRQSDKLARFHNQLDPNVVLYEASMSDDIVAGLQSLGHVMEKRTDPFNYINIVRVTWNGTDSVLLGNSDMRKDADSRGW